MFVHGWCGRRCDQWHVTVVLSASQFGFTTHPPASPSPPRRSWYRLSSSPFPSSSCPLPSPFPPERHGAHNAPGSPIFHDLRGIYDPDGPPYSRPPSKQPLMFNRVLYMSRALYFPHTPQYLCSRFLHPFQRLQLFLTCSDFGLLHHWSNPQLLYGPSGS